MRAGALPSVGCRLATAVNGIGSGLRLPRSPVSLAVRMAFDVTR